MMTITEDFGFIYVFGNDECRFYKIGAGSHPQTHIDRYRLYLPFRVEMIHIIGSNDVMEGKRRLHAHFELQRLRGEWFSLCDEDIVKIRQAARFCGGQFETEAGKPVELMDQQERDWLAFLRGSGC